MRETERVLPFSLILGGGEWVSVFLGYVPQIHMYTRETPPDPNVYAGKCLGLDGDDGKGASDLHRGRERQTCQTSVEREGTCQTREGVIKKEEGFSHT